MEETLKMLSEQHPIMLNAMTKELSTKLGSQNNKERLSAEVLIIAIGCVLHKMREARGLNN